MSTIDLIPVGVLRKALLSLIDKLLSDPRCSDDRALHLRILRSDLLKCKTSSELTSTYVAYCDSWDALHSDFDVDPDDD